VAVFKAYFGTVDEDSLRNNFVLIYELLDGARRLGSTAVLALTLLALCPLPSSQR
jgi:hypothetical protein